MHLTNNKGIAIFLAVLSTHALADGFNVSVGGDYSTGKYGTNDKTNVFYMPFVASYATGRMTYKLNVPFIRVNGPGAFVPGGLGGSGGGSTVVTTTNNVNCTDNSGSGNLRDRPECQGVVAPVGGPAPLVATSKRTTESGLGDISAMATFNALNTEDWIVDLTGRVKLPTGSESKGLGNGEVDYALQVNVDKYFGAPFVSVGIGYRWLGEPRGVKYDNVTYGSIGGGYTISNDTSIGISYDWATAAVDGSARPQEVSVYGSTYLSNNYKLSGVLYTGLSNASPDIGGGLTLTHFFSK